MTACVVPTRADLHTLSNVTALHAVSISNYTAQAKQRYQMNRSSIAARCHSVVLFHHLECDLAAELRNQEKQ